MRPVNDYQIGGNHYHSTIQHWDAAASVAAGYFEGAATKYICRARKKHSTPLEDYRKALHYLQKLLTVVCDREKRHWWLRSEAIPLWIRAPLGAYPRPRSSSLDLEAFCAANHLDDLESRAILAIFTWVTKPDLVDAINTVQALVEFHTPTLQRRD